MSGFPQQSNPFHQYDTRYKPSLPQRTNAMAFWERPNYVPTTNYVSQYNQTNTTNKVPIFVNKSTQNNTK